ncbi:unnamed protein product [Calicophoron daubneyi]|uniref:5'-nucleotidase n=1 Tax=Calicophoron daubneyi TaxID=300641 RepID=A0AAV2U018_CALDB
MSQGLTAALLGYGSGLGNHRVILPQPEKLDAKLNGLISGGIDSLQVICDFDQTLSKYQHEGSRVPVSHGALFSCPGLPVEERDKLAKFVKYYTPIEKNLEMSVAEKCPYMVEYWSLAHELLIKNRLHRSEMESVVKASGIYLRDDAPEFMRLLRAHSVPLLIFSAGVGNVIEQILDQFDLCSENVKVIANFMDFDQDGYLVGFQDPLIHSLNKTLENVQNSDFCQDLVSHRPCVLLIGDSVNDVHMIEEKFFGGCGSCTIVRIGFLNELVSERLEKYKSAFDVVVLEDETFDVPLMILNRMIQAS